MSNETFWAIKRRERASREKVVQATEAADEVPYRDLQAKAKELEIPANQSREDLEAAIAQAEG